MVVSTAALVSRFLYFDQFSRLMIHPQHAHGPTPSPRCATNPVPPSPLSRHLRAIVHPHRSARQPPPLLCHATHPHRPHRPQPAPLRATTTAIGTHHITVVSPDPRIDKRNVVRSASAGVPRQASSPPYHQHHGQCQISSAAEDTAGTRRRRAPYPSHQPGATGVCRAMRVPRARLLSPRQGGLSPGLTSMRPSWRTTMRSGLRMTIRSRPITPTRHRGDNTVTGVALRRIR